MFVITTIIVLLQILASHSVTNVKDPDIGPTEEFDMMLTDRISYLGLVTVRVVNEDFCVVINDLKKLLGYIFDENNSQCESLKTLYSNYGIPLTLDMTNVELHLSQDFDYPAKAFTKALERINRVQHNVKQPNWVLAGYRPTLLPSAKRIDITLRNYNSAFSKPEIHSAVAGDLLGGTVRARGIAAGMGSNDPYKLINYEHSWFWRPQKQSSTLSAIEFGSRLYDPSFRHAIRGFMITNKPISSRNMQIVESIKLNAPLGSIVEWIHPSGNGGHHIMNETEDFVHNTSLGYGLNKLSYLITIPGELTKEMEKWIRIPSQLTPKGMLDYQATIGTVDRLPDRHIAHAKVDYGINHRLSFGIQQVAVKHRGQMQSQIGSNFVLRPSYTSEIHGRFNSDSEYSVSASYWSPNHVSIELADTRQSENTVDQNRFSRRYSMLRTTFLGRGTIRPQLGILRTAYNLNSNVSVIGNVSAHTSKWILATNTTYQWWGNNGTLTTGYATVMGHASYRASNKLVVGTDLNSIINNQFRMDWIRFFSYYNAPKLQIGTSVSINTVNRQQSFGISARVHTDWLTGDTQYEFNNRQYYGSQTISTSWMKSQSSDWHPSTQSGQRSSGLVFVPFHDANGNGLKDRNEPELTGLMGTIKEGRIMYPKKSPGKLMFSELQPHRNYVVQLSADLRDEPDYMVQSTHITVDTPGSGFRVIYVPVVESFEVSGSWTLGDKTAIQPGQTFLLLTKIDGSQLVKGTLFGDGTWLVDKIAPGTYNLTIVNGNKNDLVVTPATISVDGHFARDIPKIIVSAKS